MAVQAHYNDNDYKNWLRACLGLKYLKEGLVDFVDAEIKRLHEQIITNVCGAGFCNQCVTNRLTDRRRPQQCPNNVCHNILNEIEKHHRYTRPCWENTDATKWCTDHWEIGKCFMAKYNATSPTAMETDCTALLSICINGKFLPPTITSQILQPAGQFGLPTDIFHKNRDARNALLHSGSMSINDAERQDYIDDMIKLLANYKTPVDHVTQSAIDKLNEVNTVDIDITPAVERSLLQSKLDAMTMRQTQLEGNVQEQNTACEQHKEQMQRNAESLVNLCQRLDELHTESEKDIADMQNACKSLQDRNESLHRRLYKVEKRLDGIETVTKNMVTIRKDAATISADKKKEPNIEGIQRYLMAKYKQELKTIPLPPLLQRIRVNLDDVYTELIIRDDLVHKATRKTVGDDQSAPTVDVDRNESGVETRVKDYADILHDGKEPCKNVFVIGKAGVGKTTWSRKLVSTWCDTMSASNTRSSSNEATLRKYDLVFYIELRSAKSVSHIMNMIEGQLFPNEPDMMKNVKTLMENEEYSSRCLIVLDGLDEWVSLNQSTTKNGLPARDPRWKSTIITTTRSWKLEELQLETQAIHRAVEIRGLQEDGAKQLVKHVVSALNTSTGKYKNVDEFNKQCHQLVRRCMEVPLLLNTFVCLWYEEGHINELLAGTFRGLVELLIKYAEGDAQKRLSQKIPSEKLNEAKETWKGEKSGVPDFFFKRRLCSLYGPFLLRLGKISFDHLFSRSRESSLVFDHQSITDVINKEELEIALTIGLLSQTTHCESVLEEQFSLSFLHKTLQEFLASVYMVSKGCQSNPCLETYREYCTDVYKVLEMENVLMFVSGMCPEMAGKMSRHIASMERNEEVHQMLLRCVRQERIASSTSRQIYIKHHFLFDSYASRSDDLDYNEATISHLGLSNDKDATLCLDIRGNLDILKCIANITNIKLVEATMCLSTMSENKILEFINSIPVVNNKQITTDNTYLKIIISGTYLEKLDIFDYKSTSEQYNIMLDLSGCKCLKRLRYCRSTVPIRLPTEQLEVVVINGYTPDNAPVLDLSRCKSLRTVECKRSSAPIQLPTAQLEKVDIYRYTPRNARVLDLSRCKYLRTVKYKESTVPIQLPTDQLQEVVIFEYKPRNRQVLDLSGCKSLRTVKYKLSTAPIQLPTEQLKEVEIDGYIPRNARVLDLSRCKYLRTVKYKESTVPIQLPTDQLQEVVIFEYKPRNRQVLDLSGCKSLRTVEYKWSTAPIQLPTEQLENVNISRYIPDNSPVLDLSGCKFLRTVQYKLSTAPIQLPTAQLEVVDIYSYTPHNAPVLHLSGCKSLITVQYKWSTAPIQLPTAQLEVVDIYSYTPDNAPLLDLSGCKYLRTVKYMRSTVPIQLPTEQLEKVDIYSYKPDNAPVLDLSECNSLRTVMYGSSTVPIQLPTEQLENVEISGYTPRNEPVLDLSGCKYLRTVNYQKSTAPIHLPTEQLEKVVIDRYKPRNAPVLDLSGCKSLKFIRYLFSTAPVQLPPEQVLKVKVTESTPYSHRLLGRHVPTPLLDRDMFLP